MVSGGRDGAGRDGAARERTRQLTGVVVASALVYPLLLCAVQLALAQYLTRDPVDALWWGGLAVLLCVAIAAVVRWSTGRRVTSPWLLLGLVPPGVFELWLAWPSLTR